MVKRYFDDPLSLFTDAFMFFVALFWITCVMTVVMLMIRVLILCARWVWWPLLHGGWLTL